jgi:hypothetical protein
MNQTPTITIPTSTAEKLASLGRAVLDLAQEMKERGRNSSPINADLQDIPADQRWFWTPEWQAMEKEADEDIVAGRVSGPFTNVDDLVAHLNA